MLIHLTPKVFKLEPICLYYYLNRKRTIRSRKLNARSVSLFFGRLLRNISFTLMKRIPLIEYLELILKITIVGLLVYFIFFRPKETADPEYWQKPGFKTDTLHVRMQYDSIIKYTYKYLVPPQVVINYIDSTRSTNHIHLALSDSLLKVTDSLRNEITRISNRYLKQHPKASKLIYMELGKDSIRLDLLHISGRMETELYSVNYDKFKYQYDSDLRAEAIKSKKKAKYDWYLYGGYDFAQSRSLVSTEYSVYRNRYKLQGFTHVYINKEPELFLGAKLGYRLR